MPVLTLQSPGRVMVVLNGDTLVWHLGEAAATSSMERHHLYFAVTPRVRDSEEIRITSDADKKVLPIPGR